jgi:iron uptake system EfeUOB component EfeO/EfeM
VASQHIVEVLAKLMVFGFEDVIPIDLVYSSLDGQIDATVNDMMRRFV